jgi:CRP/FNR family transcriptional regulator
MISPVFLAALPYFAGLKAEEIEDIRRAVFEKTCDRNEVIAMEGEPCLAVYFVARGSVKIVKTSVDGREQVLRVMRHGDSFNDVPLFDGGPNPATAVALEPTIIWGITKEKMLEFLRRYPRIAENVLRVFSQRLRHLVALVEDLSFRHVTSRLAKMLLEYEGEGEHRLTQQEMAALVGTAREMVGRSLKGLEAMGAIKAERKHITILNRGVLQELV